MSEIQLLPFILPAFFFIFLIWSVKKWNYKPNGNKISPPSPPKLPILGNLHQLGSLPHRSLRSMAQKYGPLMLLHFGRVPVLVVSSADAAAEILKTHDITFASRPGYKAFKKLVYDGNNITFLPYGEYWRQLKSIFVLQLLSKKRVRSFRPIIDEEMTLLFKRIGECEGAVNLSEMFAEFSNDVICRSAFGTKYRELGYGKKLPQMVQELMELLGTVNVGDFIPWLSWVDRVRGIDQRMDKNAKEMKDFMEIMIQNHEESNGNNFVDILLQIHKENGSISKDSIKAIVMDAIAGGTDTISITMEWLMAELLQHPAVMEKLQSEVREVMQNKHEISDDDLEKMHYMKAVIKECLRCHPPATLAVPRVAHEDVEVKGFDISSGTIVIVNIWAIGRDPACWDEPEKFKPERFMSPLEGSSFGWIPFGGGRRGCPGKEYGITTLELLLANVVHKFNWKLPNGVVLDMTECSGLATHKVVPLLAVASKTA